MNLHVPADPAIDSFFRQGVGQSDPAIAKILGAELTRQQEQIELIASENIVSQAVLDAQGSVLTNKYAEGYPGKRYYGGCEVVDEAERLAIERAKQLFGCEYANVQPHSGSQANQAVFMVTMSPGDTFMGMNLDHGGHLTHGKSVNQSGKWFNPVAYGVRAQDHLIDYDEAAEVARAHNPKVIIAGGSAYSRQIDFKKFREIADEVGAILMCDVAHYAGLIVAGEYPNPFPHAHIVTTTTHKTLRGPRGGLILCTEDWAKRIDSAVFPGVQGGPLMHVIAAKAVAFGEALRPDFVTYQKQVLANASALADALMSAGYPIVSGGTDNHLMLVDVFAKSGIGGKQAEHALDAAGITVNKNMIPYDPRKPMDPSGVRLGSPALTTRGMKEAEMRQIAKWIGDVLSKPADDDLLSRVRGSVRELCESFPLPA